MSVAPRGLYRFRDDWVQVQHETGDLPVPRAEYVAHGYEPPYQTLPTREEYEQNHPPSARSFGAYTACDH